MKQLICAILFVLIAIPAFGQLRVKQTTTAAGAGYPMSASFSAKPATGDLLVALIGYYSSDTVTPPTGWTLLRQQYGNGAGGTTGFTSFYHFVVAGEPNGYVFNQGGNAATLALYDIAGADAYQPFNNFLSNAQRTTTASVTNPAVTPSVMGTLPLAAIASEGSQPVGALTSGWSYTPSASTKHPVGAAYGPMTSSTNNTLAPQFSLSSPDSYGLAAFTVLVNPDGTTGRIPVAVAGGPYAGVTSFAISFDGSASSDPRFTALTYAWNFGDGTKGTGAQPTHVYAAPGNYNVSLTVTNATGEVANTSSTATINPDCSSVALGNYGAMNSFVPSATDAWHQDISGAAVDPMSNTILVTNVWDLAGSRLHPDFGGRGAYGIPYTVVDSSTTPFTPVAVTEYADESDVASYPIPTNMPVEGSPNDCSSNGDNHAIVFDKRTCAVYEMYHTQSCSTSGKKQWSAGATTIWDLTMNEKRPYGLTSVDAAGLSVFEGLIRYDEITAGVINHAIRFTAQHTKNNSNNGYFTGMATHAAGDYGNGIDNIEGMRIRMKANFDISRLTPQAKIIATAMKKYGMILADNGSNLFFQGTPDLNWNDDDLGNLKLIPASAFEVIDQSLSPTYTVGQAPLYPNGPIMDAVSHPDGAAPTINSFTASTATVAAGQSVTLTSNVSNSSYTYIDQVGLVRGAVTVTPTTTTTYTLTSRNSFGTATATTTVKVTNNAPSSLVLTPIADKTYGVAPFTVTSTSNSSGATTYAVLNGPAKISASVVTITGVGSVTLQASQVAAGSFAATTAQTSFTVNAIVPTLALTPVADRSFGSAPLTVSSTSNSWGASSYSVVSGPATVWGNIATLTGVGKVVMMVSQAAAGNYAAATATTSFNVTGVATQLVFKAIPTQTYGAVPFTVSASSNSPASISYAVLNGPAIAFGNIVALTGVGTVTLQASQAAVNNYAAATATTTFTVNAPITSTTTLTFPVTAVSYLTPVQFNARVAVSGNAGATGSVSLFDGSKAIANYPLKSIMNGTIQGTIQGLGLGVHLMTAVYSGDSQYPASRSATVTITVTPKPIKACGSCVAFMQ